MSTPESLQERAAFIQKRRATHDASERKLDLIQKGETPRSSTDEEGSADIRRDTADLIEPRHNQEVLARYVESSSELGPVIQSIIANTIGYGYRIVEREHASKNKRLMTREQIELENFFEYANGEHDWKTVLEQAAWDYFLTGNAYLEILRGADGKPNGVWRVPAYQVRISKPEARPFAAPIRQVRRTPQGYAVKTRIESKAFRRYAQTNRSVKGMGNTGTPIWFKEFQDSREYDRDTGLLVTGEAKIAKLRAEGKLANELVHICSPIKRGPYGLPYYIGNLASVNGDILAESVNLETLRNNNIPSMFISVSGGQLTPSSIDRLSEFAESKLQGNDNRSRFIILESETLDDESLDTGRSRINIDALTHAQHNDAMFSKYSDECRASIRRSFRVPEILIGRGSAASGVVVAANMKLADEQVFSQERARFADWINRRLMPELGISNWVLELNSPNATDPATLVQLLTTAEKTGGLTPKIARMVISEILSRDLGEFAPEIKPDVPYSLQMAEAVKKTNDAGRNNPSGSQEPREVMNGADPTEPTQQFTSNPAGDGSGSD